MCSLARAPGARIFKIMEKDEDSDRNLETKCQLDKSAWAFKRGFSTCNKHQTGMCWFPK